jgi:cytochrome P450
VLEAPGPVRAEMVRAVPAIRRDPLTFLQRTVARFGDLVAFPMPGRPVLLVNDPDAARRILQDNHRNYTKDTPQYAALSAVTGRGLLTCDGEEWLRRRRIAQPAFGRRRLELVAEQAAATADRLGRQWDGAGERVAVDADAAAMRATLDLVTGTLLATGRDAGLDGAEVVAAVDAALRVVVDRVRLPLPRWLPTPSAFRLRRSVATLDRTCERLLARARAGQPGGDLLGLLAAGAGPGGQLTDREIRDELVTAVIAGHETVASALVWTLHLLAGAPEVRARMHAELDAALPGGRAPVSSDLPRLGYARAVVEEALRLYPPAWVLTRRAAAPDVLADLRIPAGTLVLISPWLLHRRADDWPDPERFAPERFLGAGDGPARAASYLPFGAGPRLCIGRDLALAEVVLVLAGLLATRDVLRPDAAPPVRVQALVTLRPRGGLPLLLPARAKHATGTPRRESAPD